MFKMEARELDLVNNFEQWQKITTDVYNESKDLKSQLSSVQKQAHLCGESEKSLKQISGDLCLSVEQIQAALSKRCNVIEENKQLKEQLETLRSETTELEEQHRKQMTEATENLQVVQEAHKKDLHQIQTSVTYQMKKEVETLQKTVQDKNEEISSLQKLLADTERDKHTEIVKLRLEYDAKLLKLQKQNSKSQVQTSSLTNSDIFRRKLQAVKLESEKEVTALRKRVSELEKLSSKNKLRKIN